MDKYKFGKALELHDAIETLRTIQLDMLDPNRAIEVATSDEGVHLAGFLYERFRAWVETQLEDMEREFERI